MYRVFRLLLRITGSKEEYNRSFLIFLCNIDRQTKVRSPVFIYAPAKSVTTLVDNRIISVRTRVLEYCIIVRGRRGRSFIRS